MDFYMTDSIILNINRLKTFIYSASVVDIRIRGKLEENTLRLTGMG